MNEATSRSVAPTTRTRTILHAKLFAAALLLMPLLGLIQTHAQPVPKLNSLSPKWVQHGTTVEISFSGENLTNATGLLFSTDPDSHQSGIAATDLTIKDDKALTAKITVVADAAPGEREVRVVTPSGVSEPLVLNLSDLPEVHLAAGFFPGCLQHRRQGIGPQRGCQWVGFAHRILRSR